MLDIVDKIVNDLFPDWGYVSETLGAPSETWWLEITDDFGYSAGRLPLNRCATLNVTL